MTEIESNSPANPLGPHSTAAYTHAREILSRTRDQVERIAPEMINTSLLQSWSDSVEAAEQLLQQASNHETSFLLTTASEVLRSTVDYVQLIMNTEEEAPAPSSNALLTALTLLKQKSAELDLSQRSAQAVTDHAPESYHVEPAKHGALTARSQLTSKGNQIALLSNGNSIAIWEDSHSERRCLRGQLYCRDTTEIGEGFTLELPSLSSSHHPSVIALNDDGFLVYWTTDSALAGGTLAQRFQNDGRADGATFALTTTTSDVETDIRLISLPNGGFAAFSKSTQREPVNLPLHDGMIRFTQYDARGVVVQDETSMQHPLTQKLDETSIIALFGGGYALAWADRDTGTIRARVFDSSGRPLHESFSVNAKGPRAVPSSAQAIALHDGSFLVSWRADTAGLFTQKYDVGGTTVWEAPVRVDQSQDGQCRFFRVAELADENVIFIWESERNFSAQILNPSGIFTVDSLPLLVGANPALFATDKGFRILWKEQEGELLYQDYTTGKAHRTLTTIHRELKQICNLLGKHSDLNDLQGCKKEVYSRLTDVELYLLKHPLEDRTFSSTVSLITDLNRLITDMEKGLLTEEAPDDLCRRQLDRLAARLTHAITFLDLPTGVEIDLTSVDEKRLPNDAATFSAGKTLLYNAKLDTCAPASNIDRCPRQVDVVSTAIREQTE